ncbi:MAG: hypothetical protein ACO3EZ_19310 [Prochlorotrichaceae cyanobacterium]
MSMTKWTILKAPGYKGIPVLVREGNLFSLSDQYLISEKGIRYEDHPFGVSLVVPDGNPDTATSGQVIATMTEFDEFDEYPLWIPVPDEWMQVWGEYLVSDTVEEVISSTVSSFLRQYGVKDLSREDQIRQFLDGCLPTQSWAGIGLDSSWVDVAIDAALERAAKYEEDQQQREGQRQQRSIAEGSAFAATDPSCQEIILVGKTLGFDVQFAIRDEFGSPVLSVLFQGESYTLKGALEILGLSTCPRDMYNRQWRKLSRGELTRPFEQGLAAYFNGHNPKCPYPSGSSEEKEWVNGFKCPTKPILRKK